MGAFNPSLLLENNKAECITLETYREPKDHNYLESILEFNLDTQKTDINGSRLYYKSLLEQHNQEYPINEGISPVAAVVVGIVASAIAAIIAFFSGNKSSDKTIYSIGDSSDRIIKDALKRMEAKEREVRSASYAIKVKENINARYFKFKNGQIKVESISDLFRNSKFGPNKIEECISLLRKEIDSLNLNDSFNMDSLQTISNDIKSCIQEINATINTASIEYEDRDVSFYKYLEDMRALLKSADVKAIVSTGSKNNIPDDFKALIHNLDELKKELEKEHNTNLPKEIKDVAMLISNYVNNLKSAYMKYAKEIYSALKHIYSSLDLNAVAFDGFGDKEKNKAAGIDGYLTRNDKEFRLKEQNLINMISEEFSIASFTLHHSINSIISEQMAQEYEILLSEDTSYDQMQNLIALDEAISAKIKNAWRTFIDKVKNIFAKVSEAIASLGTTKRYLDKYKKVILGQNFVNETYETRDIINAIPKILNYELPSLNYATMEADLDESIVYFNKYIKPSIVRMNGGQVDTSIGGVAEPKNVEEIGTYCNDFFLGPKKQITTATFQENIKDIYDYMYDYRKISNRINKDISKIEKDCNEIMKKVGVSTVTVSDNGPGADGDTQKGDQGTVAAQAVKNTPATESFFNGDSYYSVIYETVLTEDILNEIKKVTGGNGTVGSDNTTVNKTGTVANNMKNVADAEDGVDNKNAVGGVQDKNIGTTRIRNYAEVTTMVLRAKLTAVQFTHTEFDAVIRNHVKNYIADNTSTRENPAENKLI